MLVKDQSTVCVCVRACVRPCVSMRERGLWHACEDSANHFFSFFFSFFSHHFWVGYV